ncbi:MAG: CopD family protein [Aggregatilineales bacterium]
MPASLLALSLFVHLLATLIWVGGLLVTVLLVWPEMNKTLSAQPALYQMLAGLRKRFYPLSQLSLVALVATGLFQMTASPFYEGVLNFDNLWSQILLLKHLVIVLMVISGVILQYGTIPALERASILRIKEKDDKGQWERLRRREILLTWLNVGLGVLVLAFSAGLSAL